MYKVFVGPYLLEAKQPEIVIMMGAPGSGKTTWVKRNVPSTYVVIDPDDINKTQFKGDLTTLVKAFKHALGTLKKKIMNRRSVVLDATGANFDVLRELFDNLTDRGYITHLVFIDVPLKTALERAQARADSGGRFVHPAAIEKTWHRVQSSFQQAKRLPWHNITVID